MTFTHAIKTGRVQRSPRILLYGVGGIGKSTFAAGAPAPIFIPTEDGLDNIDCSRFDLCETFDQFFTCLSALVFEEHKYQTVVVDSVDWLERLIWTDLCVKSDCKTIEKVDGGYGKGYTRAVTEWSRVIELLARLRDDKKMAVILIAHSKCEKFEDPETSTYDRYSPRLHKFVTPLLSEWCDAVGFATREMRTTTSGERTIAKPIGDSGGDRIVRFAGGPAYIGKNRYGITDNLPLNWQSFFACYLSSTTVSKDQKHDESDRF